LNGTLVRGKIEHVRKVNLLSLLALVLGSYALFSYADRVANPGEGEHFSEVNWSALATDPDAHEGATVEIAGKVLTAPERDEAKTFWRMSSKPKASEPNMLVEVEDPDFKIAKDDDVFVYGTVTRGFEAQNVIGRKINGIVVRANSALLVER
jgi:hypothetical protein